MIERRLRIRNELGLHARAAAKLVKVASRFSSRVRLSVPERPEADGRSILSVMLLAARPGTEVLLRVEGEDESEAARALSRLIEGGFGEKR